MSNEPILSIKNVSKDYRLDGHVIPVLTNINLDIQKGEWIALTGPSGCGKSTLLNLLGNLDTPNSGKILLEGKEYNKLWHWQQAKIRKKRIGFIFQSYQLFPELNALENVILPARSWFADSKKINKRAIDLLTKFGLEKRLKHRPQELSGGEQQRVAITRALLNNPDIILADEPTGNLDTAAGNEIMNILIDLHKTEKKTIIMVTHDQRIADLSQKQCDVHLLNKQD